MQHFDIIKLLIACQVATLEHFDEEIGVSFAKDALIKRLNEILKLAKKLD